MLLELWVGWVTAFGFDLNVCVCCCVVVLVVYLGLYLVFDGCLPKFYLRLFVLFAVWVWWVLHIALVG